MSCLLYIIADDTLPLFINLIFILISFLITSFNDLQKSLLKERECRYALAFGVCQYLLWIKHIPLPFYF